MRGFKAEGTILFRSDFKELVLETCLRFAPGKSDKNCMKSLRQLIAKHPFRFQGKFGFKSFPKVRFKIGPKTLLMLMGFGCVVGSVWILVPHFYEERFRQTRQMVETVSTLSASQIQNQIRITLERAQFLGAPTLEPGFPKEKFTRLEQRILGDPSLAGVTLYQKKDRNNPNYEAKWSVYKPSFDILNKPTLPLNLAVLQSGKIDSEVILIPSKGAFLKMGFPIGTNQSFLVVDLLIENVGLSLKNGKTLTQYLIDAAGNVLVSSAVANTARPEARNAWPLNEKASVGFYYRDSSGKEGTGFLSRLGYGNLSVISVRTMESPYEALQKILRPLSLLLFAALAIGWVLGALWIKLTGAGSSKTSLPTKELQPEPESFPEQEVSETPVVLDQGSEISVIQTVPESVSVEEATISEAPTLVAMENRASGIMLEESPPEEAPQGVYLQDEPTLSGLPSQNPYIEDEPSLTEIPVKTGPENEPLQKREEDITRSDLFSMEEPSITLDLEQYSPEPSLSQSQENDESNWNPQNQDRKKPAA